MQRQMFQENVPMGKVILPPDMLLFGWGYHVPMHTGKIFEGIQLRDQPASR